MFSASFRQGITIDTAVLLGGGVDTSGTGDVVGAVASSEPNPQSGTPTGWIGQGVVVKTTAGGTLTVIAYAICGTA
jgi:hypothetical protein